MRHREDELAAGKVRRSTYVFDGGRAMLYGDFGYGILRSTIEELVRGIDPGASAC